MWALWDIVTGTNVDTAWLRHKAQKCLRHFAVLPNFVPVTMLAVSLAILPELW